MYTLLLISAPPPFNRISLLQNNSNHEDMFPAKCQQSAVCPQTDTDITNLQIATQLFQPTLAISWWASSFVIDCTEGESPQQELEERPHSKSCDFDTKYKSYLLVTL